MSKTIDAIHNKLDISISGREKPVRDYMGASGLGVECQRQLWYSFHQPKKVEDPKILRKFEVGNYLEPMLINWMTEAGFTLFTTDQSGRQFGFVDGKIAGSCDGVIKGIPGDENTPYLIEYKTANQFSFKQFQKDGIDCNDKYKGQVLVYMNKLGLKKCLFMVVNKDSQELYFEIVESNDFEALRLIQRGHSTAEMEEAPDRHYPSRSFFKCKFCNWYKECWQ